MTDNEKRKKWIRIGKIIIPNLIPIAGILFFEWGIFEVAFTYLLETAILFLVFFIDKFFIDKKTRYPVFFALIQLFFLIFPFGGLIFAWTILIFKATEPEFSKNKKMFAELFSRYEHFELIPVLAAFFIFEMINYYLKNGRERMHQSSNAWYNMRKLLIVHIFVVLASSIYGAFTHSTLTGIFLIIGFKIILDYFMVNDKWLSRFDGILAKFATAGLNEDGSAKGSGFSKEQVRKFRQKNKKDPRYREWGNKSGK